MYLLFKKGAKGIYARNPFWIKYGEETGKIALVDRSCGRTPKDGEVWECELVRSLDKVDIVRPLAGPFFGTLSMLNESGWETNFGWAFQVAGPPDEQIPAGHTREGFVYLSVWRRPVDLTEGKRLLEAAKAQERLLRDAKQEALHKAIEAVRERVGLEMSRHFIETAKAQAVTGIKLGDGYLTSLEGQAGKLSQVEMDRLIEYVRQESSR